MLFFIAFLAIPLIEISLLVTIGGEIGLPMVIAIVVGTALIGSIALRSQGRSALRALQTGGLSAAPTALGDGVLLLVAGVCLITPGFMTDVFGLAMLVPPVRRATARALFRKAVVYTAQTGRAAPGSGPERPRRPDDAPPRGPDRSADDAVILDPPSDDRR